MEVLLILVGVNVLYGYEMLMIAFAIRTLTLNNKIIPFVLSQMATSYDPDIGMINGAWPVKKVVGYKMAMPTYHLVKAQRALTRNSFAVLKHSV